MDNYLYTRRHRVNPRVFTMTILIDLRDTLVYENEENTFVHQLDETSGDPSPCRHSTPPTPEVKDPVTVWQKISSLGENVRSSRHAVEIKETEEQL